MAEARSGRGMVAVLFVGLCLVAMWAIVAQPRATQTPPLDAIQLRSHAVEKHGTQALKARRGVFDCNVEDLRAKICPAGEKYGMRVHFWCQPEGSSLCPGMVTTIGGVEKTSFIKVCDYWERCHD